MRHSSKALHDGYLNTGVPGWGTAYQYAAVSNSDPDRIMNFLRSRAEEQVRTATVRVVLCVGAVLFLACASARICVTFDKLYCTDGIVPL